MPSPPTHIVGSSGVKLDHDLMLFTALEYSHASFKFLVQIQSVYNREQLIGYLQLRHPEKHKLSNVIRLRIEREQRRQIIDVSDTTRMHRSMFSKRATRSHTLKAAANDTARPLKSLVNFFTIGCCQLRSESIKLLQFRLGLEWEGSCTTSLLQMRKTQTREAIMSMLSVRSETWLIVRRSG